MDRRWRNGVLAILAFCAFGTIAFTRGLGPRSVGDALSSDGVVSQQAVAALREAGPQGLAEALRKYDESKDPRLLPIIDAVAAQRDAVWSRLYWYTDLQRGETAAQAQHKPILYLRLMGKLTDEYSCANSRFFRTVLYANHDVSKLLREQFILVWESERPVPVVTVDYGDGRILKRTLTGNSIHYVLTPDGRVADALPGLYAPQAFISILAEARGAARSLADARVLEEYASRAGDSLLRQWTSDQASAGAAAVKFVAPVGGARNLNPTAMRAMRLTASKRAVEMPLLARISPTDAAALDQSIDAADAAVWRKIAALHLAESKLDASSIAVIQSKNPVAYANGNLLQRTVTQFEQTVALDTVQNDYQFRRRILGWLRDSKGTIALEDLNRRVYSEMFLTPGSDPWLGLVPDATYSALPGDGIQSAAPVNRENVWHEAENAIPYGQSAFDCFDTSALK